MLLPRGEIADGLLAARSCADGGNQVALRPARGLSSPLWSMSGLPATFAELQHDPVTCEAGVSYGERALLRRKIAIDN